MKLLTNSDYNGHQTSSPSTHSEAAESTSVVLYDELISEDGTVPSYRGLSVVQSASFEKHERETYDKLFPITTEDKEISYDPTKQTYDKLPYSYFEEEQSDNDFWSTICCFDVCLNREMPKEIAQSIAESCSFVELYDRSRSRSRSSISRSSTSRSSMSRSSMSRSRSRSFRSRNKMLSPTTSTTSFVENNDDLGSVESTNITESSTESSDNGDALDLNERLLDEYSFASMTMFSNSTQHAVNHLRPTPLFDMMQTKQWHLVSKRIKSHPKELRIWVYKEENESIAWAMLPIHAVCLFGPPIQVMRDMIKMYPRGVTTGDSGWRLPIHIACHMCTSANIVRLLLNASPGTVDASDICGYRCLNLALESKGQAKHEVVRLLDHSVMNFPPKPSRKNIVPRFRSIKHQPKRQGLLHKIQFKLSGMRGPKFRSRRTNLIEC